MSTWMRSSAQCAYKNSQRLYPFPKDSIPRFLSLWIVGVAMAVSGCTGVKTFGLVARAGDTVALATGWNQSINRNNLTVQFTDVNGAVVTYNPGDEGIRAVVQLYPDPISKLMVEYATSQSSGIGVMNGPTIGSYVDSGYTNHDADWNQTVVYLDLPTTLAPGLTSIVFSGPSGILTNGNAFGDGSQAPISPIKVNVISGTGISNPLQSQGGGNGASLPLMERQGYYTVTFTAPTIPDSIQVNLTHPVGTAKPWVVNPRGDLKNVAWRDDGATNLRVILSTSHGDPLTDLKHFKFYVASGVPLAGSLTVASVTAYDALGNSIPNVAATAVYTP